MVFSLFFIFVCIASLASVTFNLTVPDMYMAIVCSVGLCCFIGMPVIAGADKLYRRREATRVDEYRHEGLRIALVGSNHSYTLPTAK